ncbi:MAG: DNA adenine methylase, partial [Actinomycetota bacterium]
CSWWTKTSRYAGNNTSRPRSTHHYIDRLEAIAVRLQQVLVENVEAAELLERHAGDPDVVLYLDPPYLDSVRRNDGRDGQGYALDANTPDDHRRWAEALTDARAAVFISGYPSGLYDELYDGWYQTSTSVRTDLGNRGARTEVVWSNRPIAPQRLAL